MRENEHFISTRVLGWGGFLFGLVATIISVLTYITGEKDRAITNLLEADRLVYETMDLLLFRATGPDALEWNFQRGKFLTSNESRERLKNARRKINSLETINPNREELPLLKFAYYTQFGDINKAKKQLLDKFGRKASSNLLMMAAVFQANMEESSATAREYFDAAINNDPDNPELHRAYGNVLHTFGENVEAEKELEVALDLLPSNTNILNDLAHVYSESGQMEKAKKILISLVGNGQANGRTYNSLGVINFYDENLVEAIAYYEKAVELEPKIGLFHRNLSLAYSKTGDDSLAEKHKRLATQDGSFDIDIYEGKGAHH